MQKNFENHMPPPAETKTPGHNYPDIMFGDGRMMVWDMPTNKYQSAPVGYLPATRGVQMGDMVFFPVAGAEFVGYYPRCDPVEAEKQRAKIQWIKTLGMMRWVVALSGVAVAVVCVVTVAGYLLESVAAFATYGAPLVAAAVGNVVSILLWGIGIFIAGFFFYAVALPGMRSARENMPPPGGSFDKSEKKQGPTVNINVNQSSGDIDNAQNFINTKM